MPIAPRPKNNAPDLYQHWEQVLREPTLRDLPYKIETNRYGQIVMTSHKPAHSGYRGVMAELLRSHRPAGVIAPEFAEIERKAALYFARGAKEVWVCDEGRMSFYVAGIALGRLSVGSQQVPAAGSLPE